MPEEVIYHSLAQAYSIYIRYTNRKRLKTANLKASVGTTGDPYVNALAETVNGLYKMEVIKYLKSDWICMAISVF